jgi:hypothetical protein
LRWRYHDATTTVGGEDESKKHILKLESTSAQSYYEILPFGRLHAPRFR